MKKLLLVVLAAVGMASCVQTEELAVANNKEAIAFDTFVENVTKTLYNTGNLDHFKVYGTISQNGAVVTNIFPGVDVTKDSNGAWGYSSQYTQYWIPGFVYDFTAIVDGEVAVDATNGMPTSIKADMAAQEDILYATVQRPFSSNETASKVGFTFAHLLSKAKFTVKNTIANGQNFVYNIESVTITNADATAVYDVANHVWSASGTYPADFGVAAAVAQGANTVGSEVLLVPGTKELEIEIAYNLTYTNPAGNEATLVNTTKNLTAVLTLEQGKAYNFVVEFGNPGEEIVFDVTEVLGWENGDVAVNGTANVDTAEELTAAFASNGIDNIVLDGDILLNGATRSAADVKYTVAKGKNLTIDLNGHTIKAFDNATASYGLITNSGNLSIVGSGSIILSATNERNWNSYSSVISNTVGGNLVVDGGVTIEHLGGTKMAYALDNLTNGRGTKAVATIKSATLKSTYRAVRQFLNGTEAFNELYVKAGAVIETTGNKAIWMQSPNNNANSGKLVVEAGAELKNNVYVDAPAGAVVEISVAESALVNDATVDIELPEGYAVKKDENDVYSVVYDVVMVTTAEELAEVVNSATEDITVGLANDLEGTVLLKQKQDVNVTILGNDKNYNGVLSLRGYMEYGTSKLTIKNVHFNAGATADACILGEDRGVTGVYAYSHCVTIDHCTFSGNSGCAAVRHKDGGESNYTFKNCEVDNTMHSFIQSNNILGNLVVENCKVYSKNGANLNSTCNATFTGCEFDVRGYAVRVGVNSGGNPDATKVYTFTNCNLKSQCEDGDAVVIVRKDAQKATLNFVETTLEGTTTISGFTSETTINGIELPQQNNQIWYTATSLVHAHYYKDKFGEGTDLVSNVWDETTGKGVITLSGDVTKIGQNAFYYDGFHDSRENLISISLPNTVTEIGEAAFDHCPNLTTVTFNNNLVTIGPGAFIGCAKLTNVILPESLTTIGNSAFNSCTSLKSITIPAGVTSIGNYAFNGISEIKVYCKPTTPPTVGSTPFNKWWAEIYVPTASLAAYQQAWGSVVDNIYDGNF